MAPDVSVTRTLGDFTVRSPRWHRVLFTGMLLACALLTLVFFFLIRSPLGLRFGFMTLLFTLVFIPITASSFVRRLGLAQDRLRLVQITGSKECFVREVAALQLTTFGNGLSRCAVVRSDGTFAFGPARAAWPTADLVRLAEAMGVPAQG